MNRRDELVLRKIVKYADEVKETICRFELTSEKFAEDFVVRMLYQCVYCRLVNWWRSFRMNSN